jgi:Domain of unknown function (DUF397)
MKFNGYAKSSLCSTDGCIAVGVFEKSSRSNGTHCVNVGAFEKSSLSESGNCVTIGAFVKSSLSVTNGGCVSVGAWDKPESSYSNGNCVQVGAWHKSGHSTANGHCVAVGAWEKADGCNAGNCVQTGAFSTASECASNECVSVGAWHKSGHSTANGHCVAVSARDDGTGHMIGVRDTKQDGKFANDADQPTVWFELAAWAELQHRIRCGEFPLVSLPRSLWRRWVSHADEIYRIGPLEFNRGEWKAFTGGVRHLDEDGRGEFDLTPELEREALAGATA